MGIVGGGRQFEKKSFSTMGEGDDIRPSVMSESDRERFAKESEEISKRPSVSIIEPSKKQIMPYGNRILVRKKKVGDKLGSIILAADETKDRDTDLAIVVYVPNNSFADNELIASSESIIKGLTDKAKEGNAESLKALLDFNHFLLIKAIQPGDEVLISKYVGVTFHATGEAQNLTLVDADQIIGIVRKVGV